MTIETVFFNFIENTMKGILLNLDKRNNLFSLLIRINDASKKDILGCLQVVYIYLENLLIKQHLMPIIN